MGENPRANFNFIYDLYRGMVQDGLTVLYRGHITPEITTLVLSTAENNLNYLNYSNTINRRVYFTLVEALQNITRHYLHNSASDSRLFEFFSLRHFKGDFLVTTGNTLEAQAKEKIRQRIDLVNSMSKDELKAYCKQILEKSEFSDKGGMGLGLPEMARKSGNKLAFDFVDYSDALAYFFFQVIISGSETNNASDQNQRYFENSINQHRFMVHNNLMMVYQGDCSQANVKNVIGMIDQVLMDKKELRKKKRILNVIVELLQNISKHGDGADNKTEQRPGIFIMGKKDSNYVLTSSNIVHERKAEDLIKKIERVNKLNFDELDLSINVKLMNNDNNNKGAGMGLLDMKLKSNNNIIFDVKPLNDEYTFFSIQIIISDTEPTN